MNLTPLETFEPIRLKFGNDAIGMADSLCRDKGILDVGQDQGQHQLEESAMPH